MRAITLSEPIVLPDSPSALCGRRCHAGEVWLDPRKLIDFNQRIGRCVSSAAIIIDADGLSCLARKLLKQRRAQHHHPAYVSERLRCAALMDMMLHDRGWKPEKSAERVAAEVIEYVRSHDDQKLIPNDDAVVGRLDDAILVDCVWPVVKDVVLIYCDYRRLRLIEAELHGRRPQRVDFTRKDYDEARQAEAQLYRTQRRIGLDRYVDTTSPTRHAGIHGAVFAVCR